MHKTLLRRVATLENRITPKTREPRITLQVRFGKLVRLPADYQGERHTDMGNRLPDRDGQQWVEFAEVPGPPPSLLPQDRRFARGLDVVFVEPYPARP